jgi:uncharacterized membrane protein YgcG
MHTAHPILEAPTHARQRAIYRWKRKARSAAPLLLVGAGALAYLNFWQPAMASLFLCSLCSFAGNLGRSSPRRDSPEDMRELDGGNGESDSSNSGDGDSGDSGGGDGGGGGD